MFGKSFVISAAVASAALTAGVAFAGPGTVAIDTPTGTTRVADFPAERTVSVTFEHSDGQGGGQLCGLDWSITVTGPAPSTSTVGAWSDTFTEDTGKTCSVGSHEVVTRQVTIPSKGIYTVSAALTSSGHAGSDTETVEFLLEESSEVKFVYRAAPAVANSLLKGTDVKGRDRGQCIKAVARHMGPRTDFDGMKKSDVDEYTSVVDAFLAKTCRGYTRS